MKLLIKLPLIFYCESVFLDCDLHVVLTISSSLIVFGKTQTTKCEQADERQLCVMLRVFYRAIFTEAAIL